MLNEINTITSFKNASAAYDYFYPTIMAHGKPFDGTKALFNVGFYLENPTERNITAPYRGFNMEYAHNEWEWYLSGDPSIDKLGEINGSIPPIWETMADAGRTVRSNYGWQWNRNNQLDVVVNKLKNKCDTRQAALTIFDGKEYGTYNLDTPCTFAVQFSISDQRLNMSVMMRSNDLHFGFCNDQYCFSMLQELVAKRVGVEVGSYYHFANNLHVYERHFNLIDKFKKLLMNAPIARL